MSAKSKVKVASQPKIQLPQLQSNVEAAVNAYLSRLVADYHSQVLSVTLYGSQARGDADIESDIDLFIVIEDKAPGLRQALIDLAWEIQFETNVVISDIIYSLSEFQQMQADRFPYYQNIEKEGVLLWKSRSEPTLASG